MTYFYLLLISTLAACSLHTSIAAIESNSNESERAFLIPSHANISKRCIAGITAVASSDVLVTALTFYATFHCNDEPQSEPCRTWQSIMPATVVVSIVTTVGVLGYCTVKKILSSSGTRDSCELRTIELLQSPPPSNQ